MNFISAVKKGNFSLFLQGKQGSDTTKAHLIQDALLLPGSKKGARILHSSSGFRINVTKQPSRTVNGQRTTANGDLAPAAKEKRRQSPAPLSASLFYFCTPNQVSEILAIVPSSLSALSAALISFCRSVFPFFIATAIGRPVGFSSPTILNWLSLRPA